MPEYYAKLFVNGGLSRADLLAHVTQACGGTNDGWTVVSSCHEIDVRPNDEAVRGSDDFLYFPYTVEVSTSSEQCEEADYVRFVGTLMRSLHDAGMQVVAACDWEEDLPGSGRLCMTPAPIVPEATARLLLPKIDSSVRLIGFWCDGPDDETIAKAGAPPLTHPREHADPTMPVEERERIAAALDSAPMLALYCGWAENRMRLTDAEPSDLGDKDRGIPGWRWPEGLSYYVRVWGVRLDPEFLAALLGNP